MLLAASALADEPQVHRDLAYAEPKNERQTLDVSAPKEGKKHPIILWIHGGGWQAGDKTDVQVEPQAFVEKGFVFVSINYRLLPNASIKEMAGDVARAIRWVHDHAQEYGGDPDLFLVMGHSAGAQLAALVCTDDRYLKAEGLSLSILKGCVPVDGDTYDVPMQIATVEQERKDAYRRKFGDDASQKALSPVTHVARGKSIPPFLILHVADHPETTAQSQRLARALLDAGVPAKAHPAKGKNHGTINADLGKPEDEPTRALLAFVRGCLPMGPLSIHPNNSRYFGNPATGRVVYLTGSHVWNNLQDMEPKGSTESFDFDCYLNFLVRHHHNFIRLWRWESTGWDTSSSGWKNETSRFIVTPHPWKRTGPGMALDGKPKFDLTMFDPDYFTRLRSRVQAARQRGIYVSVMLFEGWGLQFAADAWEHHPFHPRNNIKGINGDANGDKKGVEIHELADPKVTAVQEAYVRKVIETIGDLDNVLYEISNENHPPSTEWQYHMIRFIQEVERARPQQHPVGMTFQYKDGSNKPLFNSPADWVAPSPEGGYRDDPPINDGRKVVLNDTDHLWGIGGNSAWVWKSFLWGHNPLFMDPYDGKVLDKPFDPKFEPIRRSLGQTLRYAERLDLATMVPSTDLASSDYCLASAGRAYLIFLPNGGNVTVDLSEARVRLSVEWFYPSTGQTKAGEPVNGGGKSTLKSPFESGDSVVLIQSDGGSRKRSYSTRFRLDEDPISEDGKWINGGKDGIDWYNVITKNGVAYGAVTQGDYTDPTALLTGTWGKNQKVKARVFSRNQTEKYYQEVEIRLRSKIAPHLCTGYEVFWRCLKIPNAYAEIVKWNGKVRDWTSLKKLTGAQYGVKDGDLVEASIVGNVIKGFVNGVEVISVTDDTYAEGCPGMGFNYGVGETNGDFGFTSYEVETSDD
jgi:acetyl esterase/lipase